MKKKSKLKTIFKIIIYCSFLFAIVFASITILYINKTIQSVKNIDLSLNNENVIRSELYTSDNTLDEKGISLTENNIQISELSDNTINAFISIEDKDFYKHNGLNYKRIVKATMNNIKSMSFKEGASTITQQLVKNKYLSNEKTINRKIKEAYLAIKLENQENKDNILESYLNTIYFGNGAYGIYDASKLFFNKSPKELTLSESCILAGSIKAPSIYSPINNYENSINRRNLILKEMLEDEMITIEEYDSAINEEVILNYEYLPSNNNYDIYNEFAINEVCEILNINRTKLLYGGYKIYTYKDSNIQRILDKHINNDDNYHINSYGNIGDSLAMIINNNDYTVSAISGKSKYNLYNIKRQPGSLIKPIFTYAPALEEKEIFLCSQILDEKIEIDNYSPNNVGNKFNGYVGIRDCLSQSLNIPTVKLTEKLGISKCKEYAEKVGIEFDKGDTGYALSLGGMTTGVTLKDITDSYSVFTNDGNYNKSTFIRKITDKDNNVIYGDDLSESNVYSADTAYLMTDTLKYAVEHGTSKKLSKLPFDVAGKTGTVAVKGTNLNTDAYSLAYTTNHTMSVWIGNYTMQEEYNLEGSNNGGTYATKIILDTFNDLYLDNPPQPFSKPDSIIECTIDNKSLDEDHIVMLGNYIPERYQKSEIFSISNIPKNESKKFTKIYPFELISYTSKNSIILSFDTLDYITYKIYRKDEYKDTLLKTISSNEGKFEYIDSDIEMNKLYTYYVIAKCNFSDDELTTNKTTNKVIKEYDKLIIDNNNDSFGWLFT